jgi:1-acyl-sn-glycerol-3-phosphate acyltransferase
VGCDKIHSYRDAAEKISTQKGEQSMKKAKEKTVYYSSFKQDFDGCDLDAPVIDSTYRYERIGMHHKALRFILYRLLASPAAFIYTKLITRDRYVGKEKLRAVEGGYFVYSNHTQPIADAFAPSMICAPKATYIIISPKNFSLPVIGKALHYLGGIPIPSDLKAARAFGKVIEKRISRGHPVFIYPEAHVWPFMKDIRPFGTESFTYPVRLGTPVFTATRTYKKTKRSYRCIVYIDGPFYPDRALGAKDAKEKLHREVTEAMKERAGLSDAEIVRYLPSKDFSKGEEDEKH